MPAWVNSIAAHFDERDFPLPSFGAKVPDGYDKLYKYAGLLHAKCRDSKLLDWLEARLVNKSQADVARLSHALAVTAQHTLEFSAADSIIDASKNHDEVIRQRPRIYRSRLRRTRINPSKASTATTFSRSSSLLHH